jgi:hypothetical protein
MQPTHPREMSVGMMKFARKIEHGIHGKGDLYAWNKLSFHKT